MAIPTECVPFKTPGSAFTAKCSGAVTGCTLVKVAGDRTGGGGGGAEGSLTVSAGLSTDVENVYLVATCTAGAKAIGVAGWSAVDKAEVKVFTGGIVPLVAGEAITAGWELESNAEGKVVKLAAGKAIGIAMTKAGSGAVVEAKLY